MSLKGEFFFVLVRGFSLLAVSSAIDVLRAANLECGSIVYRWHLLGVDAHDVESSSGVPLPCSSIHGFNGIHSIKHKCFVAVCGGDTTGVADTTELQQWLRSMGNEDISIGSLSDGAFVVAASGLFKHRRSTIHWKNLDSYRARFPDLDSRASILEMDENRFSCAGGTASLDLFLQFVLLDLGTGVVASIAENYFHDTLRDSSISQNVAQAYRFAGKSRVLAEALRMMSQHLEQPMSIADIANQSGTTHRSLDRLFVKHLRLSPGKYYRQLRLNRAANLLLQTGMPVSEIAQACGFGTASHLGVYFKQTYCMSPGRFRTAGRAQTSHR